MSNSSFSVNVNSQTVKINVGDNIDEIKQKFGDKANTIFEDIDKNTNGTLDTDEIEALKSNLEKNNFEINEEEETPEATQAHGNSSARAFNDAVQNMKNRYSSDTLTNYFKGDEDDLHTVKSGDTLYAIAKKALQEEGLSTDYKSINNRIAEIANINNLPDVNNIRIGTKLKVKLTDDGVAKVKENDNNSAKAFGSVAEGGHAGGAQAGGGQAGDGVDTSYNKHATLVDGKASTITVTKNGLNMGKGIPVDKDGNELKDKNGNPDFKNAKYKEGGNIMKYTQGDKTMFQTTFAAKAGNITNAVALSAPTIEELNNLKKQFMDIQKKLKPLEDKDDENTKKTKSDANLAAFKELIEITGGNTQVIKNIAEFLKGGNHQWVDKDADNTKAFVQDLILTRNADVVKALTTDKDGKVDLSILEKDKASHEALAGMYQEIREKEKAGEKLTDDEVKLKDALVNTRYIDGFKIDADEANQVNEKLLAYDDNGELLYTTYVNDVMCWASDEKLLDEFTNKLKAAYTDEKKAALFKEYANTKDVELARCLLTQAKLLKAKDEDIKTVINANGMEVLDKLDRSDDAGWSDDIKNTMVARIKDIYTKDKGNLENAKLLYVANDWINKLPEDQQKAAKAEIAETYFEKTTTKDEDGNDKVEYTFNPKRRPTKEEMNELCKVASDDMKKAMGDYIKLNDMGKGQYNEVIEGTDYSDGKNPVIENYSNMVDSMTDKKEVLDFIDNKIATDKNYNIPFDKILEKFPDDQDIKDKLLANIDENSTISDKNRLALAKTYLKEENGNTSIDKSKLPKGTNAVNVLKALPTDCKTGDAEKCFKAVLKELGKNDLDTLKAYASKNPDAVKARLGEIVNTLYDANKKVLAQGYQTVIDKLKTFDSSLLPKAELQQLLIKVPKLGPHYKGIVFKLALGGIQIKDKNTTLENLVKAGAIKKLAEDKYQVGKDVYDTSWYIDKNSNDQLDNGDLLNVHKLGTAQGWSNGRKMYNQLRGLGSGDILKMLKSENPYENCVTADSIVSLVTAFNIESPEEGLMQYIANESTFISAKVCNNIIKALLTKANTLNLQNSKNYSSLNAFITATDVDNLRYDEETAKSLDFCISELIKEIVKKQ